MTDTPTNTPPLQIIREKGYTRIKATVRLRYGLHVRPRSKITKLCIDYDKTKSIKIFSEQEPKKVINPRSMMNIMGLAGLPGTKLELIIEGTDEAAEKLARRVYEIIEIDTETTY